MAEPYAKLSDTKNDQGFFVVEQRTIADAETAEERGLVKMPNGGPGWWYDEANDTFQPPIPPLAERQSTMREQAEAQYQASLERGFSFDGGTFPATGVKRSRVAELVAGINAGKGLPQGKTTLTFRDQSGTAHDLVDSGIVDLGAAGSDLVDAADDRLEQLFGEIEAATSHADLDNNDLTANWPPQE